MIKLAIRVSLYLRRKMDLSLLCLRAHTTRYIQSLKVVRRNTHLSINTQFFNIVVCDSNTIIIYIYTFRQYVVPPDRKEERKRYQLSLRI
jgi:hypothetical protein